MDVDEGCGLDIFEMASCNNEPRKDYIIWDLLLFRWLQVDVKDIKCPLKWSNKCVRMFPIVRLLVRQILGIIGPQIEIKCNFSLVGILTNLCLRKLQTSSTLRNLSL